MSSAMGATKRRYAHGHTEEDSQVIAWQYNMYARELESTDFKSVSTAGRTQRRKQRKLYGVGMPQNWVMYALMESGG